MLDKPILVTLPRPAGVALFFFSSRRRHTRCYRDWSSDVRSSDLPQRRHGPQAVLAPFVEVHHPGLAIGSGLGGRAKFGKLGGDEARAELDAETSGIELLLVQIGRASCRERG